MSRHKSSDTGTHPARANVLQEAKEAGFVVGTQGSIPAVGRVVCTRCHRALQNVHSLFDEPYGRVCVERVRPILGEPTWTT